MADLPITSFEEIAKALEQKVKDYEVAFDALANGNLVLQEQLANAQNEVERLRAALRTSEEVREQTEQLLIAPIV